MVFGVASKVGEPFSFSPVLRVPPYFGERCFVFKPRNITLDIGEPGNPQREAPKKKALSRPQRCERTSSQRVPVSILTPGCGDTKTNPLVPDSWGRPSRFSLEKFSPSWKFCPFWEPFFRVFQPQTNWPNFSPTKLRPNPQLEVILKSFP